MDSISRDHSPELRPKSEAMIERSQLVDVSALEAEAALYAEFWDQPADPTAATRPVQGVGNVINLAAYREQQTMTGEQQRLAAIRADIDREAA